MSETETTRDHELELEDDAAAYETPEVEDLPSIDGPAVTAAGTSATVG
jgi:hypothetical protein